MKKVVWALLLILTTLQLECTQTPAPQDACGFVQNSDGQRVSWKGVFPIKLWIDSQFPTQYYQDIQTAIDTWQASIGTQVFSLQGTLPAGQDPVPAQDGVSVIYWLANWQGQAANQQANTTIYWVDNRITEADVRINAQDFTFADGSTTDSGDVDIPSLILHELGHVLGLKHDDADPSVMATYLQAGTLRRTLYQSDNDHISCEY